ncbi:MAG: 3-isopropylmalate dehydratase small subunit [Solirubrobacteraceae bacterium]
MNPIETISGKVSHLDRADVDTDQIMPKQFLKRVERTGFGQFLFYDWAREPGWDLPANPILVAGENFGCGSSREHAPWGLEDYGFEAIVAPSFADIFYSNCTKIGLLPVCLPAEHCRGLAAAGEGQVDLRAQEARYRDPDGQLVRVPFEIDGETRRRLLEGLDDIGVTLSRQDAIAAYEARRDESDALALTPATTAL